MVTRMAEKIPTNQGVQISGPWTAKEIQTMRSMAALGAQAIAESLGRSLWSVRNAARRHRISLRRTGVRVGLVLGQPRRRGVSFAEGRFHGRRVEILAQIRQDVLAGRIDPSRLEQEVRRRVSLLEGAPLCPSCAMNPQERATGLCDDCHIKSLADAHRSHDMGQQAQRELWRERQRKVRRRRKGDSR